MLSIDAINYLLQPYGYSIGYTNVTDGQTGGRTDGQTPADVQQRPAALTHTALSSRTRAVNNSAACTAAAIRAPASGVSTRLQRHPAVVEVVL